MGGAPRNNAISLSGGIKRSSISLHLSFSHNSHFPSIFTQPRKARHGHILTLCSTINIHTLSSITRPRLCSHSTIMLDNQGRAYAGPAFYSSPRPSMLPLPKSRGRSTPIISGVSIQPVWHNHLYQILLLTSSRPCQIQKHPASNVNPAVQYQTSHRITVRVLYRQARSGTNPSTR